MIHAKIIKKGKDVTLPRVIEIAILEVCTQRHIDRMQKTATVNYVQYGNGSKKEKSKSSGKFQSSANGGSSGSSGSTRNPSKSGGKGRKVPLPTDICWRCGKGRHQKGEPCKAVEAVCRNCSIKGHFEKVCVKGKHSTHLVNIPEASTSSTSDPDYYNEYGDPVYAHMANVQDSKCKHLIQFLISTELEKVRNLVESSNKCLTVLLKADTSADVNLIYSRTFDYIFKDRTVTTQLTENGSIQKQ